MHNVSFTQSLKRMCTFLFSGSLDLRKHIVNNLDVNPSCLMFHTMSNISHMNHYISSKSQNSDSRLLQ